MHLQKIVHVCILLIVSHKGMEYELKCPDSSHRSHRIRIICKGISSKYKQYSCLFNQFNDTYDESCSEAPDFVRPGEKYVISGYRKNINCTASRYQPFKWWSHSYSKCVFSKSPCSEFGQIIYTNGSTTNDRACRCDHTQGYTFLKIPTDPCYCVPDREDCTCYKKSCPDSLSLVSDYKCKMPTSVTSSCHEEERSPKEETENSNTEDIKGEGPYFSYRRNSSVQTSRLALTSIISVLVILIFSLIILIIKQQIVNLNSQDVTSPCEIVNDKNKEKEHSERKETAIVNIEKVSLLPIECDKSSSLENFIKYIGLKDFYPHKLQTKDVMKVQCSTVPLAIGDIALLFATDILMLNFKGRDKFIQERLKESSEKYSFLQTIHKSDKIINPLDLTIGIFKCSSPMLKCTLALKLFMCKLAVPLIFPNYDDAVISVSILPLRSITIDNTIENGSIPKTALDCPCHVISFFRIDRVCVSKSKLANEILNEQHHNTFFNKDCPLGTSKRQISDGLIEAAWHVPTKSNVQNKVTMFLNLRGDGKCLEDQLHLLASLSSVCIIMIEINKLLDETCLNLLDNVLEKVPGVILAIDGGKNVEDEVGNKIKLYEERMKKYKKKTMYCVLGISGRIIGIADIKQDIKDSISKLINQMPLSSIYQRIQASKHPTDEDERDIVKVNQKVQKLRSFPHVSHVDLQLKAIQIQFQSLKPVSQVLELSNKMIIQEAAIKDDRLMEQEDMCVKEGLFMKTFIHSFWELAGSENESQVFVLFVQSLLEERNRRIIPQYQAEYLTDCQTLKSAEEKFEDENTIKLLRQNAELREISLSNVSFGFEHLCREMGQIYEAYIDCKKENTKIKEYLNILPKLAAKQLLMGQPFQLMDGDVGKVPIVWIKAVFCELNRILGEKKCLVLSVLGIQSSGKSTLLNTMFGLQCAVTAGRCTKGVYIQLVDKVDSEFPFDIIILVDTEGLRAPELAEVTAIHDNKLATFIVGICDITVVNIKGENAADIKNVMQTVVKAILRQKNSNNAFYLKQRCIFTHQNVHVENASEKMVHDRHRFLHTLDEMTSKAAQEEGIDDIKTFNQVIQLDLETDVWYFSDLWLGNPPMAPANPGYSETAAELRKEITKRLIVDRETYLSITDTFTRIEEIWKAM